VDLVLVGLGVRCVGCRRFGSALCRGCAGALTGVSDDVVVDGASRALAAFEYGGAARKLVLDLKLRHLRPAAPPLGEGIVRRVWQRGLRADVLTWVPGRRKDNLERGFDHARSIASHVSRGLGIPLVKLLDRDAESLDQAGLGRAERADNLRSAFRARPVNGMRVALVDDLITTGATAAACTQALMGAGARSVEVITACRA
jgi:ComF family protein